MLRRMTVTVTEELLKSIDQARGEWSRGAAVEEWLWKQREVTRAATALKLKRGNRPSPGRPHFKEE
jgi:hypothetical protein